MIDFSNKVVAITGAAGNLGKTTAMTFHNLGARLAVIDRRRDDIRNVFEEIAVDFLGNEMGINRGNLAAGIFWAIIPGQFCNRIRIGAAFFLIKAFDPEIEFIHNFRVRQRLPQRFLGLVAPLGPAA